MTGVHDVVIVGANMAGVQAVESLRALGYGGRLTLVDADPDAPYNRPPLSKDLLAGDLGEEDIRLLSAADLKSLDVNLMTGVHARGLDMDKRLLHTSAYALPYDRLLIATGSAAVIPRGWDRASGVLALRTLEHARQVRAALLTGSPRVVVIGGGLIGCEVAATAREMGLEVTLIEAAPSLLSRILPPTLSEPVAQAHGEHGVRVLCNATVGALQGSAHIEAVELVDGRSVAADLVVVGVGARPETGWVADSRLTVRDGICTDLDLRAAQDVFAAGDVARVVGPAGGNGARVEHWTNARRHGAVAAAGLLDQPGDRSATSDSYVWSDQYGVRLQIMGACSGTATHTLHADSAGAHAVTLIGDNGVVVGAVGYGAGRFQKAKKLVAAAARWSDVTTNDNLGVPA